MTQRQAVAAWGLFLVLLFGFLVGPMLPLARLFGEEQPGPAPEKLLPAKTLIYIGWDGTTPHREAWRKTVAYEALVESGLGEVVVKLSRWAEREVGRDHVRMVTGSIDHLGQRGLHVALAAPTVEDGPPLPQLTIVVPGGAAAAKELGTMLNQAGFPDLVQQTVDARQVTRGRLPALPAAEIGWWAEKSHLVIAVGVGAVDAALQVAAGRAPDLGVNPLWKKSRQTSDFETALVSWIDLATIREMAGAVPVPGPGGGAPTSVAEILKTLGLENIGPLMCRWGFHDKALRTETTLEAPGPRRGVLQFVEQKPITLKELPPLPAGSDGFYASRFDWSQAAAGLRGIVSEFLKRFNSPGAPSGDDWVAKLNAELEIDLQKDFFDPLGDVMVLSGDSRQGLLGMGIGLAISVDDAKTLRTTVDKLLARLKDEADRSVQMQSIQRGTRTISLISFPEAPFISPTLTIDDNWFVIGLYPQTVDSFLLRLDGKLPGWTPSETVNRALAELPKDHTSITYSDPREGLRAVLRLAPTLISFAQMGLAEQRRRQFGANLPLPEPIVTAADFPPAEWITRSLFENVSVTSVTEREIRWSSRSSLPAVPLLGGAGIGSGGSAAPVLVALLLPAVQQAREAARRTQSKNNLKMIGLALHNFHDSFNTFPAGTHQNDKLKAEKRLSWMSDILPFLDQAPLYNRIEFQKGWEDAANAEVVKAQLPIFLNPGVAAVPDPKYGHTHYVGIAGVGKDAPTLPATDRRAGVFGYNRATSIRSITDGTSNTIGVTEASKDFGPWSAGGRTTIRPLTTKPYINGPDGLGGPFRGGMHVMMMDGSVRFVSENIDPASLEALSTIAGGEVIGAF